MWSLFCLDIDILQCLGLSELILYSLRSGAPFFRKRFAGPATSLLAGDCDLRLILHTGFLRGQKLEGRDPDTQIRMYGTHIYHSQGFFA